MTDYKELRYTMEIIGFIMLILSLTFALTNFTSIITIDRTNNNIKNTLSEIQHNQQIQNKESCVCQCEPCNYTYKPQIIKIGNTEPRIILKEQFKTYYRNADHSIEYVIRVMCNDTESDLLVAYKDKDIKNEDGYSLNNRLSHHGYFIIPGTVVKWTDDEYKVLITDKQCREQYNTQIKTAMKERFEYMNFVAFNWDAPINYWN